MASTRPIGLDRSTACRVALERELADRHHQYLATRSKLYPHIWYVIVANRSTRKIVSVITVDSAAQEEAA